MFQGVLSFVSVGDQQMKLTDDLGNPLHLFLQDGRPATDRRGRPLRNIVGNPLISFDGTSASSPCQDWKGCPLRDSKGKSNREKGYSPTQPPLFPTPKIKCTEEIFAQDGVPLTDPTGVPLVNMHGDVLLVFNPKGHPVMDLEGKEVTDKCGRVMHPNEKPFMSNDCVPLRMYDELERPLSDENGFPFTNLLGLPLVVTDGDGNPTKTVKGYPIKDSEGHLHFERGFELTRAPRYYKAKKAIVCKNNEPGIAFDVYGHPLTDMNGFPLFNLEGIPLVIKRKEWLDQNSEAVTVIRKSVYDRSGVAQLRNSRGSPVRLYDRRGYPLTDHEGAPLAHASGVVLLKFNELGEPLSDSSGAPLFDDMGNELGSKQFYPCRVTNYNEFVANHKGYGVQFFEATGMPLTNRNGVPLLNRYHELMAVFDGDGIPIKDVKGRDVYDILGLPIVKSFKRPILDPNGNAIRLYSKSGKPLTDRLGNVLKSINGEDLLRLNYIGQIVSDYKGGPLYDSEGCPMNIVDKFLSNKIRFEIDSKLLLNLDGSALCMYDIAGDPLTDSRGGILKDSSGKNLIISSSYGVISERNGQPAYDLVGHAAYVVAGRVTTSKMAVYDSNDRPLLGPSCFILKLRTGRELLKFDKTGFPIHTFEEMPIYDCKGFRVFTPLSDIYNIPHYRSVFAFGGKVQLFGCDDRPLLDITGELLFSSKGVPLIHFDKENKPRADFMGRAVYDRRGIAVANPGGCWKDQKGGAYRLFNKEGLPLTDPRGKELQDIDGISLIKRSEYGHPKFDRLGNLVYDANGRVVDDPCFLPTTVPPEVKCNPIMECLNKPLWVYDLEGMPLTDSCGKPLQTVKSKPMIDFSNGLGKLVDLYGRTLYDSRRIPLACDATTPIITMEGSPLVLYDEVGNPLMSLDGLPIVCEDGSPLLSFDEFGRPSGSGVSGLFDGSGVSIDSPDCKPARALPHQISLMSMEGRPARIFGKGGRPITDKKGNILFRADGDPVRANRW